MLGNRRSHGHAHALHDLGVLDPCVPGDLARGDINGLVKTIEIEIDLEAIAGREHQGAIDPLVIGQGRGKGIAGVAEALNLLQGCVVMACTDEHQDHGENRTPARASTNVR